MSTQIGIARKLGDRFLIVFFPPQYYRHIASTPNPPPIMASCVAAIFSVACHCCHVLVRSNDVIILRHFGRRYQEALVFSDRAKESTARTGWISGRPNQQQTNAHRVTHFLYIPTASGLMIHRPNSFDALKRFAQRYREGRNLFAGRHHRSFSFWSEVVRNNAS